MERKFGKLGKKMQTFHTDIFIGLRENCAPSSKNIVIEKSLFEKSSGRHVLNMLYLETYITQI